MWGLWLYIKLNGMRGILKSVFRDALMATAVATLPTHPVGRRAIDEGGFQRGDEALVHVCKRVSDTALQYCQTPLTAHDKGRVLSRVAHSVR